MKGIAADKRDQEKTGPTNKTRITKTVGRQVHDEIRAIVQKRAGSDLT
jgi:hypothetical protein